MSAAPTRRMQCALVAKEQGFLSRRGPTWLDRCRPKTIGIDAVADLAASAAAAPAPPIATITVTSRLASSIARVGKSPVVIFRPTVFEGHVPSFDIPRFRERQSNGLDSKGIKLRRFGTEKPDHRHRRLLRWRSERNSS
jgi:hypothetical protein